MFDPKFVHPANWMISGMTGSGKTYWIQKLLSNKNELFVVPPVKVLYCYSIWQPLFETMETKLGVTFHKGVPSDSDIYSFANNDSHNMIVLDDLQQEVVSSSTVEKLFTQICHHCCISVIFINQNLFYQGKCARTLHLNTYYTVLLKNHRNVQQISTLGRQIGKSDLLLQSYNDVMKEPYGYLLLDLSPNTPFDYQVRSHVFPNEFPIVVYKN